MGLRRSSPYGHPAMTRQMTSTDIKEGQHCLQNLFAADSHRQRLCQMPPGQGSALFEALKCRGMAVAERLPCRLMKYTANPCSCATAIASAHAQHHQGRGPGICYHRAG